jgi:hypothetical protein
MNMLNDKQEEKRLSSLLSSVQKQTLTPDKEFLDNLKDKSIAEFLASSADRTRRSQIKIIPIWRIIMKSSITKFTTAAVIIIVAIVSIYYYAGPFHGTTAAFAASDVIAAMKEVQWIHGTQQMVDTNNVPVDKLEYWNGGEYWQSIDPYRTIDIRPSGEIKFTELNTEKVYDPKNNTITVTFQHHPEQAPPASMQEVWLDSVSGLEKSGAKVEYSDGVYEGRPAKIIHVDYTKESGWHEEITIIADAETRLARKIAIYQKTTKGVSGTILMLIDYPYTGPKDIYEAGAPRDAKIIQNIQDADK